MRAAVGIKTHSGWAAVVVVGQSGSRRQIIERSRMELVEPQDAAWAKQPYHAAEGLEKARAHEIVGRGIEASRRVALREVRGLKERLCEARHEVVGCAVLVGSPMPNWTIDQILAVHVRMHKAEGVMFPEAVARAVEACGLAIVLIPESEAGTLAERSLATPVTTLMNEIAVLGKSVGPPWGRDQKYAALAAMGTLGRPGR
jgi:hypothetical protein